MANALESLDATVAKVLADWSLLTTLLALVIVAFLAYPIIFPDEPDTHPLLLARQATASPVRNKGESAVYRSPEVPHGYPLKSGLNVKDASAPRWAAGRDGDIRDIWREVQRGGSTGADGKEIPKGLIMTVLGKEEIVDHDIEQLTREIAIIGKHFKDAGVKKVAIDLPNSVEYLSTIFGKIGVDRLEWKAANRNLSCCVLRLQPSHAAIQPATSKAIRAYQRDRSRRFSLCCWHCTSGGLVEALSEAPAPHLGRRKDEQTHGLEWLARPPASQRLARHHLREQVLRHCLTAKQRNRLSGPGCHLRLATQRLRNEGFDCFPLAIEHRRGNRSPHNSHPTPPASYFSRPRPARRYFHTQLRTLPNFRRTIHACEPGD